MAAPAAALDALVDKLSELLSRVRGKPRSSPPAIASTDGPLDAINEGFHAVYGEARQAAQQQGPVFVLVGDDLVVFHKGQRTAFSFSPQAFHVIKSVAHAPVALFAMYERPQPPDAQQLETLRAQVASSVDSVRSLRLSEQITTTLLSVLHATAALLDELIASGPSRPRLEQFASALGPQLVSLLSSATRLQLEALHEHTDRALSVLSVEEREQLEVAVAGDHQARVRSLPMQYFQKRFATLPNGAQRVTYAESVNDERGALALIATQRLDRVLARSFFGEELRLQRDLLGDAAAELLRSFDVGTIA